MAMRERKQGLFVYANIQRLYIVKWNAHISLGICSPGWTVSAEAKTSVFNRTEKSSEG